MVFSKLSLSWLYGKIYGGFKSDHTEAVYAVNQLYEQIKTNKVALKCLALHSGNLLDHYLNDNPDDTTPKYQELKDLLRAIVNAAKQ